MNSYKSILIGELIGLARATDGNEHLITPSASQVIRKVFGTVDHALDESTFTLLREEILEEKRKMVPDCFLCAAPCGKTSAYDLSSMQNYSEEHRVFKEQILSDLGSASVSEELLYKGLIILGMDDIYPELIEFWESQI